MSKSNIQTNLNTQWNFSLIYKNEEDPKIKKDQAQFSGAIKNFVKKYIKDLKYTKNASVLFMALTDYENIMTLNAHKILYYYEYKQILNSTDDIARTKIAQYQEVLTRLMNDVTFFEVALSKIDPKKQIELLKNPKLSKYKKYLSKIFEASKYVLSVPEEKILSLKNQTSRSMWIDVTQKLLTKATVNYKGEIIPLSSAGLIMHNLPSQEQRKDIQKLINEQYSKISDVAESEINAVYTDKKINDELRGYKEVYDATFLSYDNDKKAVLNLINVCTKNFSVANRFYAIKAKMLGVEKMYYSDRAAKIQPKKGKSETFSFEKSYKLLLETFNEVDTEFGDILKNYVENGQIDVFPKVGKQSGAFCSSSTNMSTFVKLNHTDDGNAFSIFAHEMGHAIHSEYCKKQPVIYRDVSMSTAETASTFFEVLAFEKMFATMTEEQKIIALHDKIHDDVQTIFRQIACFNFELELHKLIRKNGAVSSIEIADLMNSHMKAYLGPLFEMKPEDGLHYVFWSHIRNFFYVYSYGYGQLVSKAMYKKYKEDKKFLSKIKQFLSAGSSASPEEIFKSIGIDVTKPDFFQKGIDSISDDINRLESLVLKS